MLEVPARTVSLTARWSAPHWSTAWTLSRAADWINYDRLALAQSMATSAAPTADLLGAGLRSFWRGYPGVTRLRASFTHTLPNGLALVLTGDNLLGHQLGEPDNVTILPGRTLTAGLRARF
jgi:iron complex outermembrane receptor protein